MKVQRPAHKIALALGSALLLLLGVWTYAFVLRLPFFSDDILEVRWLSGHSLSSLWTSSGLRYYRPLGRTPWKIIALLGGLHDPLVPHALVLALHLLNALLVLALVAGPRAPGERKPLLGFAAAALFLLYPFSYQAVPWISSFYHPAVLALILGALLLYRRAAAQGPDGAHIRRALLVASLILALLAPLAQETGVLVAPLLLLLLLTDEQPLPLGVALRRTSPYWMCAALGLGLSLLMSHGSGQSHLTDWRARWQIGVYFAQGLIYPLAPLARYGGKLGLSPLRATALLAAVVGALWSALMIRLGRGRLVLRAVGWFVLTALPAWALLDPEYVLAGPRLLYQASVGAALFWAMPLDVRLVGRWKMVLGRTLATLIVLATALFSYRYIRSRVPLYEQMRRAVAQLLAARPAASQSVLVVNLPIWLAPPRATFPVGQEGVVLLPPTDTALSDLVWAHTGQQQAVRGAVVMELMPPASWRFLFPGAGPVLSSDALQGELRQAQRVLVCNYDRADVAVSEAGGLEAERQPPAKSFLALFGVKVGLLDASYRADGGHLVLRWQCWAPVREETSIFVHCYDSTGKLVAQADGYPLRGMARMVSWQAGDVWQDVRSLALPSALAPGEYTLKVGLYPTAGGPRLAAEGPGGERFADEAVPIATLTRP